MSKPVNTRLFFFTLVLITVGAAAWLLWPYASVITLAFVFTILIRPWYKFLHRTLRIGDHLAAALSILGAFILVITPITFIIRHLINELFKIRNSLTHTLSGTSNLRVLSERLNETFALFPALNYSISVNDLRNFIGGLAKPTSGFFLNLIVSIGSSSAEFVVRMIIFIILVFVLLPILPKLRNYLEVLSPLDDSIDETYIRRASSMAKSVVEGTFVVAIAQGLIGGVFAWIAGLDYIVSLTLMMMISSIIPIVGTAIVTVPLILYLFITGHYTQALIMLFGQTFFISTIDNVIRVFIAPKSASIHPVLLLLSVLSGLRLFGGMGIFYGPIIMILCLTSLEMYILHYAQKSLKKSE